MWPQVSWTKSPTVLSRPWPACLAELGWRGTCELRSWRTPSTAQAATSRGSGWPGTATEKLFGPGGRGWRCCLLRLPGAGTAWDASDPGGSPGVILPSHGDAPTWVHQAGIPHLIGVGPRLTTALTSPYGQMPVLIPTVVPLVPANQANQSSLHNAHLPQNERYSEDIRAVNEARATRPHPWLSLS